MNEPEIDVNKIPSKQKGLTTVEYAVAGGLIVAGIVGVFAAMGGKVKGIIEAITTAL